MTVLSKQSIPRTIVTPFVDEKTVCPLTGMSYGLSVAGYDIRVKQGIVLRPGWFWLASTVERFAMPNDLIGFVHDKSTLARLGMAVQNTVIEPGWEGYLTLEITNHSSEPIYVFEGQPIAQVVFHRLDEPTEQPYDGKYQNQGDMPVAAIREV